MLRRLLLRSPAQRAGGEAETAARTFLEAKGYKTVAANQATRFGEVDLVMEKDGALVFVEVRRRSSSAFGTAAETVTHKKQARIAKAALAFTKLKRLTHMNLRFDVVAFDQGVPTHLENAFVPRGFYL